MGLCQQGANAVQHATASKSCSGSFCYCCTAITRSVIRPESCYTQQHCPQGKLTATDSPSVSLPKIHRGMLQVYRQLLCEPILLPNDMLSQILCDELHTALRQLLFREGG